jgi:hypothetical protein
LHIGSAKRRGIDMKPSPLEHLPRRSLFAEAATRQRVNTARVNTNPEPTVTLDSPKPTQRGRGRPTVHVDRAAYRREWMARKRASKASQ